MAADRYAKAAALLTGGGVRVHYASARGVAATVTGSSGKYETRVYYDARGRLVRECSCEYAGIHPVAGGCSHQLAVQVLVTGESLESMRAKQSK